ncbi:transcription factor HES-5-like [Hoplias malabaricus]|uniref:transcription factor HES-5-like n=1 Tax=Hoplias malabaricus TaxID=27720 RepID=UPI0034636BA5
MAPSAFQQRNEKVRLRKPEVEKIRRDRINNSIEQLRLLLKDQLKSRQPTSKLEKADILEMAVTYLKSKTPEQSFADGFARCLEETASFLSANNNLAANKPAVTRHCSPKKRSGGVKSVSKHEKCIPNVNKCTGNTPLWRPW